MRLLLVLVFLFIAPQIALSDDPRPVKIGVLFPLTGEISSWGTKALEGVNLAFREAPEGKVSVITEDSGSLASRELLSSTRKLIDIDKVDIIIGPASVDQTSVVAPLLSKHQIPTISLSLCSDGFLKYKNLFCSYPSSKEQLSSLPKLLNSLHLTRISLVLEQSVYADEVREILKELRSAGDFEIISITTLAAKDQDLRSVISRIRSEKPDAVFACTVDPAQSFAFFKQLKEQGYSGSRIGYLDIDEKYRKEFGKSIEGIFLPGFISNKYSTDFVDRFRAAYSHDPDMYGALGYDIAKSVIAALASANWDPKKLVELLPRVHSASPAIMGYHFKEDRTISLPIEVWRVEADGFLPYSIAQ